MVPVRRRTVPDENADEVGGKLDLSSKRRLEAWVERRLRNATLVEDRSFKASRQAARPSRLAVQNRNVWFSLNVRSD